MVLGDYHLVDISKTWEIFLDISDSSVFYDRICNLTEMCHNISDSQKKLFESQISPRPDN